MERVGVSTSVEEVDIFRVVVAEAVRADPSPVLPSSSTVTVMDSEEYVEEEGV